MHGADGTDWPNFVRYSCATKKSSRARAWSTITARGWTASFDALEELLTGTPIR